MADDIIEERSSWVHPSSWCRWKPTSMASLAQAERKMLSHIWHKLEASFVTIGNGSKQIRTIVVNKNSNKTPLVLIHGMGAGVGLWSLNLENLSKSRSVYAFDVLGFGRSTRMSFPKDAMLAEMEFVESIEEWRKEMQLEKFILLGHSLGGFLASAYAIRYPNRLHHVILVDPWGFPERTPDAARTTTVPFWIKAIATLVQPFNPLAGLRAAGPWGPQLVEKLRPDLANKFAHLYEDDTVSKYIYHCNAQHPSGETAFRSMMTSFGWAKHPMIKRITEIEAHVPITMIHGSRSWIDSNTGYEVKYLRNQSYVDVQIIKGAGHHVYADQAAMFNNTVIKLCDKVDVELKDRTLSVQQESNV